MIILLLVISGLSIIFGSTFLIASLIEDELKVALISFLFLAIGILSMHTLFSTDPQRAIDNYNEKQQIGIIASISNNGLTINQTDLKLNKLVSKNFDVKTNGLKIGDSIMVNYLETDLNKYVSKIKLIEIVANAE